jgi:hypothetical protein
VLTVLVLLRREANSPSLTGAFEILMPDGWRTNWYNYRVVRLWADDPEPYLTARVNLLPLAPLANVAPGALPGLIERMAARINAERRSRAATLWTATYLLMGLRYSDELTRELLEGVQTMQESVTYQAILRKGGVREAQRLLLRMGTKRFGEPDAAALAALDAIQDIERLESLGERFLDADLQGWDALLRTP